MNLMKLVPKLTERQINMIGMALTANNKKYYSQYKHDWNPAEILLWDAKLVLKAMQTSSWAHDENGTAHEYIVDKYKLIDELRRLRDEGNH